MPLGPTCRFSSRQKDQGTVFKEKGQAKPGGAIFKDHGYNWVRLCLFHNPTHLPNNPDYTLALAKAAKARGFKLLLNYHYSDTWADPGKQTIPKAWQTSRTRNWCGPCSSSPATRLGLLGKPASCPRWRRGQRDSPGHALARWQAARTVAKLRRLREGRHAGRQGKLLRSEQLRAGSQQWAPAAEGA